MGVRWLGKILYFQFQHQQRCSFSFTQTSCISDVLFSLRTRNLENMLRIDYELFNFIHSFVHSFIIVSEPKLIKDFRIVMQKSPLKWHLNFQNKIMWKIILPVRYRVYNRYLIWKIKVKFTNKGESNAYTESSYKWRISKVFIMAWSQCFTTMV